MRGRKKSVYVEIPLAMGSCRHLLNIKSERYCWECWGKKGTNDKNQAYANDTLLYLIQYLDNEPNGTIAIQKHIRAKRKHRAWDVAEILKFICFECVSVRLHIVCEQMEPYNIRQTLKINS